MMSFNSHPRYLTIPPSPSPSTSSPHSFFLPQSFHPRSISSTSISNKQFNPYLDYYKILNVTKSSTDKEIGDAYRMLVFAHHPDIIKGGKSNDKDDDNSSSSSSRFSDLFTRKSKSRESNTTTTTPQFDISLLTEAKGILLNPKLRVEYDSIRANNSESWDNIRNPNYNRNYEYSNNTNASNEQGQRGNARSTGNRTSPEIIKIIEAFIRPRTLFLFIPLFFFVSSVINPSQTTTRENNTSSNGGEGEILAFKDPGSGRYYIPDPSRDDYHSLQKGNLVKVDRRLLATTGRG